jgi:hypothetical protein
LAISFLKKNEGIFFSVRNYSKKLNFREGCKDFLKSYFSYLII